MNQKLKAWIFLNGDLDQVDFVKSLVEPDDLIVACDGGLLAVRSLGLKPNAVIGDFDSAMDLPPEIIDLKPKKSGSTLVVSGITYVKYPTDKDFLDSELAIDYVIAKNCNDITLVNILGSEIDHLLGTIFMLTKPKYTGLDLRILTRNQMVSYQTGKIVLHGEIGDKVSLVPITGEVEVISSTGLKYDPAQYTMSMQDNIGTRNELTAQTATVMVDHGYFLVIVGSA